MPAVWHLLLCAASALWICGCDKKHEEPLRVLAAQSLLDAFTATEAAFERAHPGCGPRSKPEPRRTSSPRPPSPA